MLAEPGSTSNENGETRASETKTKSSISPVCQPLDHIDGGRRPRDNDSDQSSYEHRPSHRPNVRATVVNRRHPILEGLDRLNAPSGEASHSQEAVLLGWSNNPQDSNAVKWDTGRNSGNVHYISVLVPRGPVRIVRARPIYVPRGIAGSQSNNNQMLLPAACSTPPSTSNTGSGTIVQQTENETDLSPIREILRNVGIFPHKHATLATNKLDTSPTSHKIFEKTLDSVSKRKYRPRTPTTSMLQSMVHQHEEGMQDGSSFPLITHSTLNGNETTSINSASSDTPCSSLACSAVDTTTGTNLASYVDSTPGKTISIFCSDGMTDSDEMMTSQPPVVIPETESADTTVSQLPDAGVNETCETTSNNEGNYVSRSKEKQISGIKKMISRSILNEIKKSPCDRFVEVRGYWMAYESGFLKKSRRQRSHGRISKRRNSCIEQVVGTDNENNSETKRGQNKIVNTLSRNAISHSSQKGQENTLSLNKEYHITNKETENLPDLTSSLFLKPNKRKQGRQSGLKHTHSKAQYPLAKKQKQLKDYNQRHPLMKQAREDYCFITQHRQWEKKVVKNTSRVFSNASSCSFVPTEDAPSGGRPYSCSHKSLSGDNPESENSVLKAKLVNTEPNHDVMHENSYRELKANALKKNSNDSYI